MTTSTQFRLANGDEILCEVMEEPKEDDYNIVVRNAMKVITVDRHDNGFRYYTFRPWMVYQDRADMLQLLNYSHIVGEAKPNKLLDDQYKIALKNETKLVEARDEEHDEKYDKIRERLEKIFEEEDMPNDEELSNVFYLNTDKDKLH